MRASGTQYRQHRTTIDSSRQLALGVTTDTHYLPVLTQAHKTATQPEENNNAREID